MFNAPCPRLDCLPWRSVRHTFRVGSFLIDFEEDFLNLTSFFLEYLDSLYNDKNMETVAVTQFPTID